MYKSLWYLGVAIAFSLNYAGTFAITVIWDVHILYSIPLFFTVSFIIGALMADIRDSLVTGTICMIAGLVIATALISGPPLVYSEGFAEIQTIFALTMNSIVKLLILNITSFVAGLLVGHILGER